MNSIPKPLGQLTSAERAMLFPVVLVEYNPEWPSWYEEEKENIVRLLGVENIVRISHYGSTAVPGLLAKPIIDILLEIKDETAFDKVFTSLYPPEYMCPNRPPSSKPPLHMMMVKGYTPAGFADRVFMIHIRYPGVWEELQFRDYLISNPDDAAEYAALKRRLLIEFEHDLHGYTEGKRDFVLRIREKMTR